MWFLLPPRMLPFAVCAGLVAGSSPPSSSGRMQRERIAPPGRSPRGTPSDRRSCSRLSGRARPALDRRARLRRPRSARSSSSISRTPHARAPRLGLSLHDHLARRRSRLRGRPAARAARRPRRLPGVPAPVGAAARPARARSCSRRSRRSASYRIDNALELSNAYRGTAMLLGDVIEADDEYTGSHSRDVVDLVLAVADRLGLDAARAPAGRVRCAPARRRQGEGPGGDHQQAGPLDDDEWEVMKTHTILGEQMLEQIGGLLGEVGHDRPLVSRAVGRDGLSGRPRRRGDPARARASSAPATPGAR